MRIQLKLREPLYLFLSLSHGEVTAMENSRSRSFGSSFSFFFGDVITLLKNVYSINSLLCISVQLNTE